MTPLRAGSAQSLRIDKCQAIVYPTRTRRDTLLHTSHSFAEALFLDTVAALYCMVRSNIHIHNMGSTQNSPPSSASPDTNTQTSEAPDSDYALLVHSQDTLTQQTGPDVDNQRPARQKRRRTRQESCNI